MNIIFGSARVDEKGTYSNGVKGDQLQTASDDYKGEVSMQSFYVHKKGWYILRAKDVNVATKLARAMKNACNNKHIGYSQSDRYSLLRTNTLTTTAVNCDCSSLVRQCIKEATGVDTGDFNTASEVSKILATGLFDKETYASGKTLYTGDILVTKTKGHTGIIVSGSSRTQSTAPNYEKDRGYVIIANMLNVRAKPVSGNILMVLHKGDNVWCEEVRKIGNAVWILIGTDSYGRELWCCAYNGTKQYIGQ